MLCLSSLVSLYSDRLRQAFKRRVFKIWGDIVNNRRKRFSLHRSSKVLAKIIDRMEKQGFYRYDEIAYRVVDAKKDGEYLRLEVEEMF